MSFISTNRIGNCGYRAFNLPEELTYTKMLGTGEYEILVTTSHPDVASGTVGCGLSRPTYTFTKYDLLNRPVEEGYYFGASNLTRADVNDSDFPENNTLVTASYLYDQRLPVSSGLFRQSGFPNKTQLTDVHFTDWYSGVSGYYAYDYNSQGQVSRLRQKLGSEPERTLTYFYDRQGNITSRRFQAGVTGQSFYTWYDYDGFGRLTEIRSNTANSKSNANLDALYSYSATGNRQALKLNNDSGNSWMEEIDYQYNMRGWLTSINDPENLGGRAFGMELHYYTRLHGSSGGNYNGNISDIRWSSPATDYQLHTYQYYYDRANRLVGANYKESGSDPAGHPFNVRGRYTATIQVTDNFGFTNPIGYDANGNFQSLRRNAQQGAGFMNYQYRYYPGTNRLQNTTGSSTANNYQYDAAGNVIANIDRNRNMNRITYDHRNLTQHISTDNGLHLYTYNSEGLRIGKQFRDVANDSITVNTRYIYGAYGELIAQYDGLTLQYWNISGPGGETVGRKGLTPPLTKEQVFQIKASTYSGYMRYYYLKDHLGSVRVTLNENGAVAGYDDFYPFGLQMPGRSSNSANPHDDQKFTGHFLEQEGDLGIYHAQARMYDPAIGRFLGVDAMRGLYPGWSTYVYAMNNPVLLIDTTGNCAETSDEDEDSDVDCIEGYELDTVVVTADRETGETRVGSISNIVSEMGFFEYSDSEGRARVAYDPTHSQGAQWLYNHFRETQSGCDNIANASMSGASHSIAMMACQHAGIQRAGINILAYTGLGIGVTGLLLTPAGWALGSKALATTGGVISYGSLGAGITESAMTGRSGGAIGVDVGLELISRGSARHIKTARNISPNTHAYYTLMIDGNLMMMQKGMDLK